ncbi:hypothetical protein ECE50_005945 [Chitinophaga sp. Mgbs1]|uniref:Uncharacterized protein n=1 Tax=Chitinophaga solisilvae TaxID=1233460 RepID=A0A3S1B3V3_9BACT|nr:hypothetical protein [Chitinophaga solisilvae]
MNQLIPPFIKPVEAVAGDTDYSSLRAAAMEMITGYSGRRWTDHNEHDPGITTLEALCYALTEQLHFSNLSVSELLQLLREKDALQTDFFQPQDILFNAPVTLLDWKKFLVDQDTVSNAWLTPLTNGNVPPLFLKNNVYNYTAGKSINIQGIYNALLQWAPDKNLGELNGNILSIPRTLNLPNGTQKTYWADLIFSFTWDSTDVEAIAFRSILAITNITLTTGLVPDVAAPGVYFATLKIDLGGPSVTVNVILRINTEMATGLERTNVETEFGNYLKDKTAGPVPVYNKIINQAWTLSLNIRKLLVAHRNLAEDFFQLSAVKIIEIGLQCDLELTPGIEIEPVLAEIFYVVDKFISPVILFETPDPQNLADSFEGPELLHGYLSDRQLLQSPSCCLFLSDILHIMLEGKQQVRNPNIIAIFNLSLQSYINNKIAGNSEENCLRLLEDISWRPRLNIFKSAITVRQRGVMKSFSISDVFNRFNVLKNTPAALPTALPPADTGADAAQIPLIPAYYPVQYELPDCYQLSLQEKTAVNTQMRGYLFFFEQLLANMQSQWQHSMQLLSVANVGTETRFPVNLRQALPFYDSYLKAGYDTALLTDNKENQLRRSLMLDHLLARLGEDFRYYGSWNNLTGAALNTAKYNFLISLPALATARLQAFDYSKVSWNSTNTATVQQKLVHLLHLPDNLSKRRWKNPNNPAGPFSITGGGPFGFTVNNGNPLQVVNSPNNNYAFRYEAEDAATAVIQWGGNIGNYQIQEKAGAYSYVLLNDEQQLIAVSNNVLFVSPAAALAAATALAAYLAAQWLPLEGMHLVEMLLLRPQVYVTGGLQDELLTIPQVNGAIAEGFNEDMYSSQVMAVLPGAGPRFGDPGYQEVAAAVIRKELPAWLQVRVVWLNIFKMFEFEEAYQSWVSTVSNPAATEVNIQSAKKGMVRIVNSIHDMLRLRGEY